VLETTRWRNRGRPPRLRPASAWHHRSGKGPHAPLAYTPLRRSSTDPAAWEHGFLAVAEIRSAASSDRA
jgi:hypothetical protein